MRTLENDDEALIRALRRLMVETGSLVCVGCGYEHSCSTHGCAIIRHALERLKSLGTPAPNNPLTPEQLWEMDGQAAYLDFDGRGEWVLVRLWMDEIYFSHKNTICEPARIALSCGGNVYRHKPEEDSSNG